MCSKVEGKYKEDFLKTPTFFLFFSIFLKISPYIEQCYINSTQVSNTFSIILII